MESIQADPRFHEDKYLPITGRDLRIGIRGIRRYREDTADPWKKRAVYPHLHIIATSGGMDKNSREWEHREYLPYPMLHKKWQWYLLEMIRERIDTEEIEQLVDRCYRSYPKGFVANVQKGEVPGR